MDLSDDQIQTIREKAAGGAQLNDIQKLIESEFSKSITFMETRFLISDLGIAILSPEEEKPEEAEEPAPQSDLDPSTSPSEEENAPLTDDGMLGGKVSVKVDTVTAPGAMMNGAVTWSDGVTSRWILDQSGRLALDSEDRDYQPSPSDIEAFQMQLKQALNG